MGFCCFFVAPAFEKFKLSTSFFRFILSKGHFTNFIDSFFYYFLLRETRQRCVPADSSQCASLLAASIQFRLTSSSSFFLLTISELPCFTEGKLRREGLGDREPQPDINCQELAPPSFFFSLHEFFFFHQLPPARVSEQKSRELHDQVRHLIEVIVEEKDRTEEVDGKVCDEINGSRERTPGGTIHAQV